MCDISNKKRRVNYRKLRRAGYNWAWSVKMRDWTDNHIEFHITHIPQGV